MPLFTVVFHPELESFAVLVALVLHLEVYQNFVFFSILAAR